MSIITVIKGIFLDGERAPTDQELADMGLTRSDYQTLMQVVPGTQGRMEALGRRFGVTPEMMRADPDTQQQIQDTCAQCRDIRNCQQSIALGTRFDPCMCPNADRYMGLHDPDMN